MSLPIAGRRRKKAEASDGAEEVKAETLGAGEAKGESKGEPKTIGWGDDMDEAPEAKSPGAARGAAARRSDRNGEDDSDGDEEVISMIPDLEDDAEEDIQQQVAEAPQLRDVKLKSLRELDEEIQFTIPSTTDDGIDLSILTSTLLPREAVEEPDEEWNYDLLLQHLSQEMQAEADEAKRRRQEAAAAGGAGVSPADGGASSGKRTSPTEAGDSEGGSFAAAAAAGAPGASVAIAGRRK